MFIISYQYHDILLLLLIGLYFELQLVFVKQYIFYRIHDIPLEILVAHFYMIINYLKSHNTHTEQNQINPTIEIITIYNIF